jgi:hypothetical protein
VETDYITCVLSPSVTIRLPLRGNPMNQSARSVMILLRGRDTFAF